MMKFLRRDCKRFSKFGKGKGKKASWRKPKGRDNKMREKRKGYPAIVSIGYGSHEKEKMIIIKNPNEVSKSLEEKRIVVGNVGKKKKIEIAKKAKELGIKFLNLNPRTFLRNLEKQDKVEDKK